MGVEGLTYTQYLYSLNSPQVVETLINLENAVESGAISPSEFAQSVESITGKTVKPYYSKTGEILGYHLKTPVTVSNTNPINSNVSTVSRGTVARPLSTGIGQSGKSIMSALRGAGTKVLTGAALVGTAAMAASVGITLGKTIDSALYNLNPDFWDSNNMSALNPETWRSLTVGDDSIQADLFNMLLGFDDNGNGQAYIDENAFAYLAAYMYSMGVFAPNVSHSEATGVTNILLHPEYTYNLNGEPDFGLRTRDGLYTTNGTDVYIAGLVYGYSGGLPKFWPVFYSKNPFTWTFQGTTRNAWVSVNYKNTGNPIYYTDYQPYGIWPNEVLSQYPPYMHIYNSSGTEIYPSISSEVVKDCIYAMLYDSTTGGVEGIGNQSGATFPDTTNWEDYNNVLPSLQTTYPDLWNNAIQYPVLQPDGTVKQNTYVPISLPDNFTRTGTQPISETATQTNPEINPSTSPQTLIDELTKILTNPLPETEEELNNPNPPSNPVPTGTGDTPPFYVPTGSASTMWAIYHPTQQQIDDFGGWLWSSDFIDQILKIFNNPMEAIIGLHKIYATPIDAGNSTIKVGYLDSEVPSAYIRQQFIELDCGTVDLNEEFGNVFDYEPFTNVKLYLPFVGIVPLNVSEVMRSSINVTYGIDVLTGACLARVKVIRDGSNAILYQYSGNCAAQYPLSSGSYMGVVSSIVGIAGSVAATVASGGSAAPLALGAIGAAIGAHTTVQNSGSFSGNAGVLGGKTPYLIIERPQTNMVEQQNMFIGIPTNEYVGLNAYNGFIKCRDAHIIGINATDEELTMISNYLMNGVINGRG